MGAVETSTAGAGGNALTLSQATVSKEELERRAAAAGLQPGQGLKAAGSGAQGLKVDKAAVPTGDQYQATDEGSGSRSLTMAPAATIPAPLAPDASKAGPAAEQTEKSFFDKALGFLKKLFSNPMFESIKKQSQNPMVGLGLTALNIAGILCPGLRLLSMVVSGISGALGLATCLSDWLNRDKEGGNKAPDWTLLGSSLLMSTGLLGANSIGIALAPIGSGLLALGGLVNNNRQPGGEGAYGSNIGAMTPEQLAQAKGK